MKLMLVGLQKMGKTTLLSRLREVNEEASQYSTFLQRVAGEDTISASGRESKTSNKINGTCMHIQCREVVSQGSTER